MLDSLGSTLTKTTINDFFTRYNKNPETDEITMDEAIICLEHAVSRPSSEKNVVTADTVAGGVPAGAMTPNLNFSDFPSVMMPTEMDFTGRDAPNQAADQAAKQGETLPETLRESNQRVLPVQGQGTSGHPSRQASGDEGLGGLSANSLTTPSTDSSDLEGSGQSDSQGSGGTAGVAVERVINIKTCPLCHQPRLSNKGEQDIVTHLAVCASSDWNRVNRIVVGNYVTASQAQRKWYNNVVNKVSSGAYQLGAVRISCSCVYTHVAPG